MGFVMEGTDCRYSGYGTLFFSIVVILNGVISSTAQTVGNDGLCSTVERSTVTFQETYQVSRSNRYYTNCGLFGWKKCTRYSVVYTTQTRVAYRDSYNIVFTCCNGWVMQADGSCQQNISEEITTQSQLTDPLAPSVANAATPTLSNGTAVLLPKWPPSSPSLVSSTGVSGSPPGEIAKADGPRTLGKGGESQTGSDGGRIGMIGGLVGVAVAVVVMISLIIIFVSKRKRRAREKRRNSDPDVVFQLLNSSSPARAPVPDIYAEIPDRDGNANSPGARADDTALKGASFDDYEVAFINNKQPSGQANTYQDPNEAGIHRRAPSAASDGSPTMKKVDMEITLGPNGAVYTKTHDTETTEEVVSPYQNVPGLDTVIAAPDIYDTVGGNEVAPAAYNHLDGTNAIPTDPDDEAYNMIVIGPSNTKHKAYDKLDRQRGGSRLSGDDQLDTPIPAASGYASLGLESRLGYDKLERHESHGVDPDRKAGTTGPNTYDELGAQGRPVEYDKLTRRGSADRGLNDSGSKNNGALNGVPNGNLVGNKYDTIEVKKPADGEIYENLPKKTLPKGLAVKLPGPDCENQEHAWIPDDDPPTSPPLSSPAVRPVYDVIPGPKRMPTAPVYDILPKSPEPRGGAPVYDTPPVVTKLTQRGSIDVPISPVVGGARPVYDTPPVRSDNTSPLQFEDPCPLYENTPTGRI